MSATSRLVLVLLAAGMGTAAFADNSSRYVYVRSNVSQPWGQASNEDAMDNTFGAGNWTTMFYEDVNANVGLLLNSQVSVIFMEGGDSSFLAFQNFIQNYGQALYEWIYSGGRLLIMAAPNDPLSSVTLYLPDNVILYADSFYGSAASSAYAIDMSNPIFWGPYPTSLNFTGDFFSHGYFTGGSSTSPIMESNLNEIVLGQDTIGSGLMIFGGFTTDNFQLPQPDAHALLENIISYTANAPLG